MEIPALVTYWSCGEQKRCHSEHHPCSRPRWIFCSQCSSAGWAGQPWPHFQPGRAAAGEELSQGRKCCQASPGWPLPHKCLAHRLSVGTDELAPGFGAKLFYLGPNFSVWGCTRVSKGKIPAVNNAEPVRGSPVMISCSFSTTAQSCDRRHCLPGHRIPFLSFQPLGELGIEAPVPLCSSPNGTYLVLLFAGETQVLSQHLNCCFTSY